jgi:hypothetical protein
MAGSFMKKMEACASDLPVLTHPGGNGIKWA